MKKVLTFSAKGGKMRTAQITARKFGEVKSCFNNLVVQLTIEIFYFNLSSSVHFILYEFSNLYLNGEFDPGSG